MNKLQNVKFARISLQIFITTLIQGIMVCVVGGNSYERSMLSITVRLTSLSPNETCLLQQKSELNGNVNSGVREQNFKNNLGKEPAKTKQLITVLRRAWS